MVAFLKHAYGQAKNADKFLMSQQPALKYTWNTMMTSSFWDMRLSIACAATDAEFQNRIILHDNTLNLPVVAQQPHPTARHTRRRTSLSLPEGLKHEMQRAYLWN